MEKKFGGSKKNWRAGIENEIWSMEKNWEIQKKKFRGWVEFKRRSARDFFFFEGGWSSFFFT
jgi:hypothetical protein